MGSRTVGGSLGIPEAAGGRALREEALRTASLEAHARSAIGRARRVNQDAYLVRDLAASAVGRGPACLLAVADGIGGAPAGDYASAIAVAALEKFVRRSLSDSGRMQDLDPGELLVQGVRRGHEAILADVVVHPDRTGMGTTMTAALVLGPKVWVAHAGDSRCYLLRGSRLVQLTIDHLLVQRLVDEGVLSPPAARRSVWRRTLWNHLGKSSEPVDPQVSTALLEAGDALLLTTDGVTTLLSDSELEELCRTPDAADTLTERVLQAALAKGGKDDRTLVFARFASPEGP